MMSSWLWKMRKVFLVYAWVCVFIFACLNIINIWVNWGSTPLIIIGCCVTAGLCAVAIWLSREYWNGANSMELNENDILFSYDDHVETIEWQNISKIAIAPGRYVFYGKKKYIVVRHRTSFLSICENGDTDKRIYDIAKKLKITIVEKMF